MKQARASVPPTGAPPTRATTDQSGRIVEAAEACFRRAGFSGTSVREVAELAGVSKSLVLYHFQSKERLYVEVQTAIYQRLANTVRDTVAAQGGTPAERARYGIDALVAALRERNDLAAHAALGARALSDPTLEADARRMRDDLRKLLYDTMEEILGEGAFPVPTEAAADLLFATLTGLGLQSALDDAPARVDRALEALRMLVVASVRAPGDKPRGAR